MSFLRDTDFRYDGDYFICKECGVEKYWYYYPVIKGKVTSKVCLSCKTKIEKQRTVSKIRLLIMSAEKNKMSGLRDHLFECLEMVKSKQMTSEEAKSACLIAQTIINSARLEIDFIKVIGGTKKSEFFQLEDKP